MQEASALLSKKRGSEGSIESQQKFDFFCSDIMPNVLCMYKFFGAKPVSV